MTKFIFIFSPKSYIVVLSKALEYVRFFSFIIYILLKIKKYFLKYFNYLISKSYLSTCWLFLSKKYNRILNRECINDVGGIANRPSTTIPECIVATNFFTEFTSQVICSGVSCVSNPADNDNQLSRLIAVE